MNDRVPSTEAGRALLDTYLAPPYNRDAALGWILAILEPSDDR